MSKYVMQYLLTLPMDGVTKEQRSLVMIIS